MQNILVKLYFCHTNVPYNVNENIKEDILSFTSKAKEFKSAHILPMKYFP